MMPSSPSDTERPTCSGVRRPPSLGRLLPLAAIILLGAFLRLYQVDLTNISDDEAAGLTLAQSWLEGGPFPLVGVGSSTGVDRPAWQVYLLVPPLLVSRDPAVAIGFIAFLNVLSVPLCYRLVRRSFGRHAALLASLLYASGFWPAFVGRNAFDVAFMAPISLLVLDRLLAVVGRQPRALGWALFWALLGVAVHPAALGLAGLVAVVALALRLPLSPARLAPGALLGALVWSPFLWHLLSSRGTGLGQAAAVGSQPLQVDLEILRLGLAQLFPHPQDPLFQSPVGTVIPGEEWLGALHGLVVALFLLSLAWCALRGLPALRQPRGHHAHYLVLALAYLVPLLVFVPHPFPIYNHYSFPVLPYAPIILALGLTQFRVPSSAFRVLGTRDQELATRNWRRVAWGGAAALAAVQVWVLLALLQWVAANGGTFWSGVPVRFALRALDAATQALASPTDPIHVATASERTYRFLLRGRRASIVDPHRTLAFPADNGRPVVYLTTSDGSKGSRLLRRRFPETERFRLLRSTLPAYYRVYVLPADAGALAQEAALQTRGPWELANGLRLEGFALPDELRPSEELSLALAWTVARRPAPPAADPRFFAHLLDRSGRKWSEANELDYHAARWREGDRVISWLEVPVPPEAPRGLYTLQFGMFDAHTQERVAINAHGRTVDFLAVEALRMTPAAPHRPADHPLEPPARFAGALELLGYDLPAQARSGDELTLRLLWRTSQRLVTNYSLFVHLRDEEGRLVDQRDGFPAGRLYPTSAWRPGEVVEDVRRLSLATAAPGQRLSVALGWYRLDTGQRLPLEARTPGQSALSLGPVVVVP